MAESVEQVFRRRLREEREACEWSQARLAREAGGREAGLYQTTVAKIEQDNGRRVALTEAVALAAALDVSPARLLLPSDPSGRVRLGPHELEAELARDWLLGRRRLRPSFLDEKGPWSRWPIVYDDEEAEDTKELLRLGRWAREIGRQLVEQQEREGR